MSKAREEQQRNSRRLTRQLLGALALVLIIIGLFTVVGWIAAGVRAAFDDSEDRLAYEQKLYGLVMFDTLPFADASELDPAVFKQAAIWSVLYQTQRRDGNLDAYERDEMTGAIVLPALEVETYLKNLLGPDYEVEHGGFETAEFFYEYSDERQGYLVPATGMAGMYTPRVESIIGRNGLSYVTVGYIPTAYNGSEMLFSVPTEPTKYMDYVFTRGDNRQWYLTALEESDRQPEAGAAPADDTGTADLTGLPDNFAGDAAPLPDGDADVSAAQTPDDDLTAEPVPVDAEDGADADAATDGEDTADGENTDEATE